MYVGEHLEDALRHYKTYNYKCYNLPVSLYVGDHLEDALDHYETLHHSDLRVNNRVRRSLGGPSAAEKDISFSILNK